MQCEASISLYTCWLQLAPSDKWGGGLTFIKVIDQNFPIFYQANYTFNKTFPLFFNRHP